MRGYQQAPRVHETKDLRVWGCDNISKHPEYINLRAWGCEDAHRIHEPKYRIRGCEDMRLQASTHQPENMRMQGCGWGHMNLRIWGFKNARIEASKYTQP